MWFSHGSITVEVHPWPGVPVSHNRNAKEVLPVSRSVQETDQGAVGDPHPVTTGIAVMAPAGT